MGCLSHIVTQLAAFTLGILLLIARPTVAYYVSIDANEEHCFFDRVVAGQTMGLMFEVAEGGFFDIDVKILGPDSKEIYHGERESSGKYTFAAHMAGLYTYCFSNKMSTMTPKVVLFTMDVAKKPLPPGELPPVDNTDGRRPACTRANFAVEQQKLDEMVRKLSTTLVNVQHEQEYLTVRERVHRSVNDNTNQRVLMWAVFEALVLIAVSTTQVYYLKRFFEVRRFV